LEYLNLKQSSEKYSEIKIKQNNWKKLNENEQKVKEKTLKEGNRM